MRLRHTFLFLILGMAVALVSCSSPTETLLQMKLVPTKEYRLSIRSETAISTVDSPADPSVAKLTDTMVFILRAEQIYDNGDVGVTVRIDEYQKAFAPFVGEASKGKSFSARLSPRGEVVELAGTDTLREQVMRLLPPKGQVEGADPEQLIENLSDQSFTTTLNRILNVWPAEPVAPGDSWNRVPAQLGKSQEVTTLRLTAIDGSGARIDFESELTADQEGAATPTGRITGEIHLSPDEGIVRSLREELDATMTTAEGLKLKFDTTTYVTFVPL